EVLRVRDWGWFWLAQGLVARPQREERDTRRAEIQFARRFCLPSSFAGQRLRVTGIRRLGFAPKEGFEYGTRSSQVVQRCEGLRLHHAGKRRGRLRPLQRRRRAGLQESGGRRPGGVRGDTRPQGSPGRERSQGLVRGSPAADRTSALRRRRGRQRRGASESSSQERRNDSRTLMP